jgi:hypothetical protein
MKGLKRIRTVEELKQYLNTCPDTAEVTLVPEEGEGFPIGGILEFAPQDGGPAQVWILIDEFADVNLEELDDLDEAIAMEWSGVPPDDNEVFDTPVPEEIQDVVQIRGSIRSA